MGVRSRTAGVLGLGLALTWVVGASPAAAQEVPPAVATWFAQDAPAVAADVLGGSVDIAARAARAGVYSVGEPVPLHRWSEGFVEGESVDPVAFDGEWVAPLVRDGAVVGTIAAVESAGEVRFSYLDDDASAGAVLSEGVEGDVLQDPQLGGLLEVAEGGDVEAVSRSAVTFLTDVADEAGLQAMVQEAHDPGVQTIAADGAGGAADDAAGVRSAVGLVLLAGGALALLRRRPATVTP
ncbi:hypothetical protein [Cellulomonas phragmiteti]|uniref:Gram-positive cocci surface proteins LPxTG domain-containing protein n=1 Tax=Cellulomonas phragmiteti TaxID=478780 RepID=A0ABQ4DIM5_9CELL|nr:hypothetical protein [Cellulomonas phragmiteti]GIG39191.1 hypothetical protein Cph01nite_09530 [Cellulomonas phragmiteti]